MKRTETMANQRMAEKLERGEAIDVSTRKRTEDGDYILEDFIDEADYCDAEKEAWIWSIGKNETTGQIVASTSSKFYGMRGWRCLWLR